MGSPWAKDHIIKGLGPKRQAVRLDVVYMDKESGEETSRVTLRQMLYCALAPYRKEYKFTKDVTDLEALLGGKNTLTPEMFDGADHFELVGCDMRAELKRPTAPYKPSVPKGDRNGLLRRGHKVAPNNTTQ